MRLFIALNINNRSKELIAKKLEYLKAEYQNVKWIPEEKWHLTLKFIGEAAAEDKDNLIKALKSVNFANKKDYLQFNNIDAFPNYQAARVIYLAVNRGQNKLIDLHRQLEQELQKYSFAADEKNFVPHLTLGRNKGEPFKIKNKFRSGSFLNIYAQIESISLYKSILKAEGPEYIKLFSI